MEAWADEIKQKQRREEELLIVLQEDGHTEFFLAGTTASAIHLTPA